MKAKNAGQKSRDLQSYLGGLGRAEQHIGIAIRWMSYLLQLESTELVQDPDPASATVIQRQLLSLRLSMGQLNKAKLKELEDMAEQRARERREATLQSMKPKIGRKLPVKNTNTSLLPKKKADQTANPNPGTAASLPNTNVEEVSNG